MTATFAGILGLGQDPYPLAVSVQPRQAWTDSILLISVADDGTETPTAWPAAPVLQFGTFSQDADNVELETTAILSDDTGSSTIDAVASWSLTDVQTTGLRDWLQARVLVNGRTWLDGQISPPGSYESSGRGCAPAGTMFLGFRRPDGPRRLLVIQGPPGEIAGSLRANRVIVTPFTGVGSADGQAALEEIEGHAQAAQDAADTLQTDLSNEAADRANGDADTLRAAQGFAAARAIAMSITLGG